jgi:hypothetical protein
MLKDPLDRIEVRNLFKALLKECMEGMEIYRSTPNREEYMNSVAGIRMLKILWKEFLGEELMMEKLKKSPLPS